MENFGKSREFQNNGNSEQRRDDRPRGDNRGYSKRPYYNNDNNRSRPNTHSNYPSNENTGEHAPKSKGNMKDEVFEMVDSGDLSCDAKAMCLSLLHVANKIEHAARVVEEFTRKVEEIERNEKARENVSRESGSTKEVKEG